MKYTNFLLLLAVCFISSCAAGNSGMMTAGKVIEGESRYSNQIALGSVYGGGESNTAWKSSVSNRTVGEAVSASLQANGLLALSDPKYVLDITLLKFQNSSDNIVTRIKYELYNTSDLIVFSKTAENKYEPENGNISGDAAIKANIEDFIKSLPH